STRLGSLFRAASRRRARLERVEQPRRGRGNLLYGSEERGLVCPGRLVETADLSHELQGGGTDLVVGDRRVKIEQHLDVSAHERHLHVSGLRASRGHRFATLI